MKLEETDSIIILYMFKLAVITAGISYLYNLISYL